MAKKKSSVETRAFSRAPEFPGGALLLIPCGLLFLLAGMAPFLAFVPWWNWLEQRDWREAKATITQSNEQLVYEYEWQGQRYMQNTYSAHDDADTGASPLKTAFTTRHKPGDVVPAYVNPADPGEAVLYRDLAVENPEDDFTFIIVFLIFFGIPGLLAVFFGFRMFFRYVGDLMAYRRFIAA